MDGLSEAATVSADRVADARERILAELRKVTDLLGRGGRTRAGFTLNQHLIDLLYGRLTTIGSIPLSSRGIARRCDAS